MIDWFLVNWPMLAAASVFALMVVFIGQTLVAAFHGQNGDDHEPPTLNTRGPDDESQRGTH